MDNNEVPAGWYDDPTNPGGLRLWDGTQWTEQVRAKPVQAVSVPVPVATVKERPVDAPIRYLPPAKEKRRSLIPFLLVTLAVIVCLGIIVWGAMFFFIPKPPQPTVFSAPTTEASSTSADIPLGEVSTVEQYRSNAFVQQAEDRYRQILASPYLNFSVELMEGDVTTVFTGYHENGYGRYVSVQQSSNGDTTTAVLITDEGNNETCVRNVTKDSPDTVEGDQGATWKCVPYDSKEGQDYYVTMERGSPLAIVGSLSDTGEKFASAVGTSEPLSLLLMLESADASSGTEISYSFPNEETIVFSLDLTNLTNGNSLISHSETTVTPTEQIVIVRSPDLAR